MSMLSNGDGVVGTDWPYTNEVESGTPGGYNRWIRLGYDAAYPLAKANMYSTLDTVLGPSVLEHGYNDSPFALKIRQGTGAGERIGRDVSVVQDDWFMRFSFPSMYAGQTQQEEETPVKAYVPVSGNESAFCRIQPLWTKNSATAGTYSKKFADGDALSMANHGNRPISIRLVGIMQKVVDTPGDFGFTTGELFESQYDIHSRFSKDDAAGYRVVYDKTKTIVPMYYYAADQTTPINDFAYIESDKKTVASFRCRLAPYLRRYEGVESPDETYGNEVVLNSLDVVSGGVSRGAISWYVFIEDKYCSTHTDGGAGPAAQLRRQTNPYMTLEVNRKTLFIDP